VRLPLPREESRRDIARAVNAAIDIAGVPYGAHVRVLDMTGISTPGGRYPDALTVGDLKRIVRRPDGIHLE
jgi:hypothetical protein